LRQRTVALFIEGKRVRCGGGKFGEPTNTNTVGERKRNSMDWEIGMGPKILGKGGGRKGKLRKGYNKGEGRRRNLFLRFCG